jgi:hypothetical protein
MAANRSTGHQKRVVFTQSWRSHVIASWSLASNRHLNCLHQLYRAENNIRLYKTCSVVRRCTFWVL